MSRLFKRYKEEVRPALTKQFGYANPMLVPKPQKVVISMGLAEASKDKNTLQDCFKQLTALSGQKPVFTKTKKAIANFKSRKDQVIGLKVTLRKGRMFDFLDRLCNITSPRIRDFRGFPIKGDGRGSYSVGLTGQEVFLEIRPDDIKQTQGMNITIVTSAQTDEECVALLRGLGFPFKTEGK